MKVLVVGLGSMGKRRVRLIQQVDATVTIIGIDSQKTRTEEAYRLYGVDCYASIDDALNENDITCAFVCTSPLCHADIICDLLDRDVNVFSEINLVANRYDEIQKKAKQHHCVAFLSSTFLYRKDVDYIIQRTSGKVVNYIYHTGQYLPDWHPWERIENFFVSDVRTNGCREIMAIEFPWITAAFGDITKVKVQKSSMTSLGLSYPDSYMLLMEHASGSTGLVAVDVVARKACRKLEVFNEALQIFWEGTPNSVWEYSIDDKKLKNIACYDNVIHDSRYTDNIIENAYADEIIDFFDCVNNQHNQERYSYENDYQVLKKIDEIEA